MNLSRLSSQAVFIAILNFAAPPEQAAAHLDAQTKIEWLTNQLSFQPTKSKYYVSRAFEYAHLNHIELALSDLEMALSLSSMLDVALPMGIIYYMDGQFDKSLQWLNWILKRDPDFIPALNHRALVFKALGYNSRAVTDFRQILKLQRHPNPGLYIATANTLLESESWGESLISAITIIDEGLALLGNVPSLQQKAIELELRRGNYGNAIQRLETLKQHSLHSPEWHLQMAELLHKNGDIQRAHSFYDSAAEILKRARDTPINVDIRKKLKKLLMERS